MIRAILKRRLCLELRFVSEESLLHLLKYASKKIFYILFRYVDIYVGICSRRAIAATGRTTSSSRATTAVTIRATSSSRATTAATSSATTAGSTGYAVICATGALF